MVFVFTARVADRVRLYLYEHAAKDLLLQRPEAEPNPFFYINN